MFILKISVPHSPESLTHWVTWNVLPVSKGTVQLIGSGDLIISCSGDRTRVGSGGDYRGRKIIRIILILMKLSHLNNRLLKVINMVLDGGWRPASISALRLAACSWQPTLARFSDLVFCLRICNQANFNGCKKDSFALLLQFLQCKINFGILCWIKGLSSYCRESMSLAKLSFYIKHNHIEQYWSSSCLYDDKNCKSQAL